MEFGGDLNKTLERNGRILTNSQRTVPVVDPNKLGTITAVGLGIHHTYQRRLSMLSFSNSKMIIDHQDRRQMDLLEDRI